MTEFFKMGGYAAFVWPSFGATLAVMVGLLVASLRALRAGETALAALKSEAGNGDEA